jgi:peroxiredoxin
VTPGDTVPDFEFLRPDGRAVRLSEFCASDALLLVFLRHLT